MPFFSNLAAALRAGRESVTSPSGNPFPTNGARAVQALKRIGRRIEPITGAARHCRWRGGR